MVHFIWWMISKLGNLFQRNKSEKDLSTEELASHSDANIRALTDTVDAKKSLGSPLRHSWTSSTISYLPPCSPDIDLNEDIQDEMDEEYSESKEEGTLPKRKATLADRFIDWLHRDKKITDNDNEQDEETLPKTSINIDHSDIDQMIIEEYAPGCKSSGNKSKSELIQMFGRLEASYRPNHTIRHIEEAFHLYSETLVESYHCSVWTEDRVFLGEVHLTQSRICFDSKPNAACKFIIPIGTMRELEIVSTENNTWFSWETLTNPPVHSIHIASGFKRFFFFGFPETEQDKCFQRLQELQKDSQESPLPPASSPTQRDRSPLLVKPPLATKKIKKKRNMTPKREKAEDLYEKEFLLTSFPHALPVQIIIAKKCDIVRGIHHIAVGPLYISQACLCFHSKDTLVEWVCVTIPFVNISKIEKVDKDTAIKVISTGNELVFFPSEVQESFKVMKDTWDRHRNTTCIDLTCFWGIELGSRHQQEIQSRQILFANQKEELACHPLCAKAWNQYFATHGIGCEIIKEPELVQLIRDGVPHEYRGYVWQLSCGSLQRLKMYGENEIDRLLEHVYDDRTSIPRKEIEKDLHRSLPHHPHFEAGGVGIQELRRVLCAYALRNPDIGYCQSMNIVCAVFLLFMSEEEVFWLLTVVAEKLLPEYYSSPLVGLMTDQRIVELFTEEKIPGLVSHLQNLGITLSIITMPWFLCLFINFLPWSATLRILDSFFLDGPVILFRITLAILLIERDNIMKQSDGIELFNLTKRVSASPEQIFDVAAREFSFITMELICEKRETYRPEMIEELGIYNRILDELSEEESDSELVPTSLYVPYVPTKEGTRDKNTLGQHRTIPQKISTSLETSAARLQKWNQSVHSLLPRRSLGHRRLHSDGRVIHKEKKRFSTSSASDICPP